MNEAELESMVVRLLGDATSYQKMMDDAAKTAKTVTKSIEEDTSHIDGFGDQLSRFGELAVAGLQVWGTVAFLQGGVQAWEEQEAAVIKLNAILETNGRNVEQVGEQYAQFATEMQRVTTMADEVTLGILAQAESFGLTGAAAEEAVRAAISLAAINDGNAQSYLRFTAAMARGDTEMMKRMARMIPQLRGIKDESELLARATRLVESGWRTAQAQANTFTGQMTQLKNAWGEILEDVGKFVTVVIKPFVTYTKQAVEWMQKLDEKTKNLVIGLAMFAAAVVSIGPVIAIIKATIVPLIGMITSGFQSLIRLVPALIGGITTLGGALFATFGWWLIPIVVAIGAAISLVTLIVIGLIRRFGGAKSVMTSVADFAVKAWNWIKDTAVAAWDYISTKAIAFYEWLRPITDAAASFAVTAWNVIKDAAVATWRWIENRATAAWKWIKEVWSGITGDAVVNWGEIRDVIQDVFLFAEYTLLNFQRVAEFAWTAVKLYAVQALNLILNNIFMILAGPLILGVMALFNTNWRALWNAVYTYARDVFINLVRNVSKFFDNLWKAARGIRVDWSGFWQGFTSEFQLTLRGIQSATLNELEASLQSQFNAQRDVLRQTYAEFRAQRLREFAALNSATNDDRNRNSPGTHEREEMEKAVKAAEKFDSVLRGSAEALSRIREYQERLAGPRVAQSAAGTGGTSPLPAYQPPGAGGAASATPAAGGNGPNAQSETQNAIREFVRRIAVATEQTAARPSVTVVGVSLS